MWVLQRSRLCFVLLESRGISACRNKRASSSMSGWVGEKKYLGLVPSISCSGPALSPPPVPPSHSKGCLAAAKGEQLESSPQHIAHVQIKKQHKQGGGSKCALSSGTESHQMEW